MEQTHGPQNEMIFLKTLTDNALLHFDGWQTFLGMLFAGIRHDPATMVICLLVVTIIAAIFLWMGALPRSPEGAEMSLDDAIKSSRRLGWITIGLFFGIGGLLAVAIPMAGAAVAPGVVSPEGSRKAVQHFEGGIIQRIHVREGQTVTRGEPLVTLEDTKAKADLAELRERMAFYLAVEARIQAERANAVAVSLPVSEDLPDPDQLARSVAAQQSLLLSQTERRLSRQRLLAGQIEELEARISGFQSLDQAQQVQLELIGREVGNAQSLVSRGLERLPRLLELQRMQAELRGEMASNGGQIASATQSMRIAAMELEATRNQEKEKTEEEFATVQAELAVLRRKIPAVLDVVGRTTIVAPIAGVVMNVRVTTEAGVIKPGEVILEIVPMDGRVVLDARINPMDIDLVRAGMEAKVVLSAYAQRNMPQIHGALRSVSADSLLDERTGQHYFLAKVDVDPANILAISANLQLLPGMPAEIFILTGERTAMDYLLRPLLNSIHRSFRET